MKPNRYIKALEIGLAHEKEGIGYYELLNKLEDQLGYEFNLGAESSFFEWFVDNFSSGIGKLNKNHYKARFITYLEDKQKQDVNPEFGNYKALMSILKKPYRLDGHAAKQYLDYLELVESRQTAQDAREASTVANEKAAKSIRLAIWAIVVSAVVGAVSIGIDLMAPKPPYDVTVIEDKTKTEQLKKDNGHLKEELYKAKMMLRAYESDSVIVRKNKTPSK